MGRRLTYLIVLALAAGFGVRMTLAQADAPATPPPVESLPVPEEVPPPMGPPPGADFPPPALPTPGAGPAAEANGIPGKTPSGPAEAPAPAAAAPDPASSPLEAGTPSPFPAVESPAPGAPAKPALDGEVERSQAPPATSPKGVPKGPAADKNPLPAAQEPSGHPASIAPNEADELVLSPDRLSKGVQSIGLTVEVKGPPTLNLNTPATYRIVVSNPGTTDAAGVVVRDLLPDELEFLSSQPTEQRGPDKFLAWHLGSVRAGTQQTIVLKVKPTRIGLFDHAATVFMRAGAKTTTQVYEPKLKVVQLASTAKVLKGNTVESRITVSNTGNGVAKGVIVRARLSPGLRSPDDASSEANQFELDLGDLGPGQHFELDPLVAEAFLGGEQWCKVEATSPDVAPGAEESKSTQVVTVVEPKLALTLVGPQQRYTDTVAAYTLTVMNPGDATARNVRVQALLPVSGRLVQLPPGARFDPSTRRLSWDPFQLDPGEKEKAKLTFEVRMGGPGLYQVTGQAISESLTAKEMTSTNVIALADLDIDITEDRRVVDVDQVTTFTIKVKNKGSKEATRILIRGRHSPEMVVKKTAGTDEAARYKQDPAGKAINGEFVFPMIERLEPGREIVLGVQVQALKVGLGTCRIYVTHDDVEQAIEDMEAVRITQAVGR